MGAIIEELKRAFDLGSPEKEAHSLPEPLERFAESVVARGLEIPAVMLLEASRPVAFLAGQTLFALSPFVRGLTLADEYEQVAAALEDRKTVMGLVARIETLAANRGERQ